MCSRICAFALCVRKIPGSQLIAHSYTLSVLRIMCFGSADQFFRTIEAECAVYCE
jgi:hypothetical protein